jgi:hypothetical protein
MSNNFLFASQRMLKTLLQDSVNRVEIYLTPNKNKSNEIYQTHSVGWSAEQIAYKLRNLKVFGSPFETTAYELVSEDITYSYDLATDSQRAIRKVWKSDNTEGQLYGIGFQEEILPSHRFPSTKDISITQTIDRKQYRINNRIQLIVETVKDNPEIVIYISYYHSSNVDMDKIERDMSYCLKRLRQMGLL